jgi:hypothetical protein
VAGLIAEEIPDARADVARALSIYGEQPVVPIDSLTFTSEQVLGDWFPDPA